MRLPELCIERPVLTTVMSLSIVIVGEVVVSRPEPGYSPSSQRLLEVGDKVGS